MQMTRRLILLTLALGFLLFCGLSVYLAISGLRGLGLQRLGDLPRLVGPQQAASVTEDLALPQGQFQTLRLSAGVGDVQVRGGGDRVQVRLTKHAERPGEAEAKVAAEALKVEARLSGGVLTLTGPKPMDERRPRFGPRGQDRVDFEITLPPDLALDLEMTAGEADVAQLSAPVTVVSRFGDLRLRGLTGIVKAELTAGAIEATEVGKDGETLKLTSRFGDVTVQDARGGLELRTNSGSLRAERVQAGGLAIVMENSFGDVQLRDAAGGDCRLENQSGEIGLSRVDCGGQLTLSAQVGDLDLSTVKARSAVCKLRAGSLSWRDGDLLGVLQVDGGVGDLDLSRVLAASYALSADSGNISLDLPADIGLDLDLRSSAGEVESDFHEGRSDPQDARPGQTLDGQVNGGGRSLNASTRVGSIHLRRLPPAVGGGDPRPSPASTVAAPLASASVDALPSPTASAIATVGR